MHLLAPLATGIPNALLGYAAIKKRGVATDATYYTDFEGLSPVTAGTNVALNSYGQANSGTGIYVNELVDVVVYNASGGVACRFTAGDAAPNVEVRSIGFTGTPYGVGPAATGEPTTLKAMADLWFTNNGAPDWKISVNGITYTIPAAFSGAALGIVFNVKNVEYAGGAEGDGATDDYAAVAAAVAACDAAGGGIVWFPPGTYKLDTLLTIPDKVSLFGAGPGASNILCGQIVAPCVDLQAGTIGQQIFGLKFSFNAASTFRLLSWAAGTKITIGNCRFDGSTGTIVGTASANAFTLNLDSTEFYPANNQRALDTSTVTAANTRANISRCYVKAPVSNASQDLIKCYGAVVSGCIIDFSQISGGNPRGIDGSHGGIVVGCRFLDAALGVVWYGIRCPEDGTGFTFEENANEFGQGADPLNGHAYDFTATEAILGSRGDRWIEITENVATGNVTLFMKEFGRCEHYNSSVTGATTKTVLADSLGPKHACCDVLMRGNPGSACTHNFSSTWFRADGTTYTFSMTNLRVWGGRFMMPGHSNYVAQWQPMDFATHLT